MRTLICLLLLIFADPAGAAIYEIALPDLQGTYDPGTQNGATRTATFHLPGIPAVVRGATLHLVGTTGVGTVYCGASQYPWNTQTMGQMLDGPGKYWLAEADNPGVAGPFDTNTSFFGYTASGPAPTWNFLSDGEGEITLNVGLPPILLGGCYTSWPPPTLDLTGAWILVDADIPTPASTRSWGAVKAIYR
jgi:hypothetical protein